MIIEQIIQLLNDSSELQTLINDKIYPFAAPIEAIPCIVYTWTPIFSNGSREQNRLEIRVIAKIANDFHIGLQIDECIRNILLTIGDTALTNDVLQCSISGGGSIKDTEHNLIHLFQYYTITNRR